MNIESFPFINELKARSGTLGIVLFGSQARGNAHPGSDIDLIVIIPEGVRRSVEMRDGKNFEIVYVSKEEALKFWRAQRDDCASLWEVARILFDPSGIVKELEALARGIIAEGKAPIDAQRRAQLHFEVEDSLSYVQTQLHNDPLTASFLCARNVFELTRLYFDLRGLWVPPPKQRIEKLRQEAPEVYDQLQVCYSPSASFNERCSALQQLIAQVFDGA